MNSQDALDTFKPEDTAKIWTAAKVQWLMDEMEKRHGDMQKRLDEQAELNAKILHAKDLKIQALVLELAHLKRMRYGKKNEALTGIQLDLFDEVIADLSAVEARNRAVHR